MSLSGRLRYSVFLTVAVVMGAGMLGMITGLDENGASFEPALVAPIFVATFIVAPWAARHLPFNRESDSK